jgi:8-oxo-dGTP pyrophosphatase MutT (NUDIX family)
LARAEPNGLLHIEFEAWFATDDRDARAGMIENEDADTTARREAYEELGVDLPSLEFVARVWSSPGVLTERQSLFLAP